MQEHRGHGEGGEGTAEAKASGFAVSIRPFSRCTLRFLCALCVPVVCVGGCSTGPNPDLAGPGYPAVVQGEMLDVQVVREETVIRLTNTTVRPYKDARLWVNRWYSLPIPMFDVGQTLELSLWDFRDEHGEAFEAGGFFATRKPERLVQAQLEAGEKVYGLVVVARGED